MTDKMKNKKKRICLCLPGWLASAKSDRNIIMNIGGTGYSTSAIQAAFVLPSTAKFTGNMTLPTFNATPQCPNLTSFILYPGVWFITGTMHFQTPETGIAFSQIVTAISTTSAG